MAKESHIDLHTRWQKVLVIVGLFALLSFTVSLGLVIPTRTNFSELKALLNSRYLYSATLRSPIGIDDYFLFDETSIDFMTSPNSKTTINADVVMQSRASNYSNIICWNAELLNIHEIAISSDYARVNGLKLGDKLYSKHVVDGQTYEYTIQQLLPDVIKLRVPETKDYTQALIIMGFDETYLDQVKHSTIVFSDNTIYDLERQAQSNASRVRYRDDEINTIVMDLLPYVVCGVLISAVLTALLILFLNSEIKHNISRFMTLGFTKASINYAFNRFMYGWCFLGILIANTVALVVLSLIGFSMVQMLPIIITCITEIIIMIVTIPCIRRKAWRS